VSKPKFHLIAVIFIFQQKDRAKVQWFLRSKNWRRVKFKKLAQFLVLCEQHITEEVLMEILRNT
jgi:hypothetical protein